MKKEFACPERPWKSTNNASNVPIISPDGTLSSGLRLHKRSGILFMTDYLTTLCDRTLVPFCPSVSALEAAAVEYTCTGGGVGRIDPRGYPTTLSIASDR